MFMHCIQELDTSGARAVECFAHAGVRYLVVPQLAYDVAGQPASMTLGDSATEALVYRWEGGHFVEHARLDVPGGEDAEYFCIGERGFLATASLRTGKGPYELNVPSTIFEIVDGRFEVFQRVSGFAAKQWTHFGFDGRHFLAFAQNVAMPGAGTPAQPADSCILEWNGEGFVPFQPVPSAWGYNWAFFEVGGERLLAYADHAVPSQILRWNGAAFEPFQQLDGSTGRAFCFFESAGEAWLAFANLHHDTLLYRWQAGRFVLHQTLSGPGGREFEWIATAQGGRLVQINFLHGTREQPVPELDSVIYRMEGGRMVVDQTFATSGGTDACAFEENGQHYLVVANSLSGAIRFRTPSRVYRLDEATKGRP
jgi:EPTP domain